MLTPEDELAFRITISKNHTTRNVSYHKKSLNTIEKLKYCVYFVAIKLLAYSR
jgi:hypothetical protein